jgi:sortase (surface protein transpeptidase)
VREFRGLLVAAGLAVALAGCSAAPSAGDGPPPVGVQAEALAQPAGSSPAPPALAEAEGTEPVPTAVTVPAIGVSSSLIGLGLNQDGTAGVPPVTQPGQASWFEPGVRPGEVGPAVLLGHVSGRPPGARGSVPGVFARLAELAPGDDVAIDRADGTTVTFEVVRVETHDKDAFPTAAVWGDQPVPVLRLVTCGGVFDRAAGSYESNVVVFAELER